MNITITGRHLEITEALKNYLEEKISKIEHYFDKITEAHVILTVEKYRHICEINIQSAGFSINGKEESGDMYSAIDIVIKKITMQLKKHKEKIKETKRKIKEQPTKEKNQKEEGEIIIEEVEPKPLSIEEALTQLKNSKNNFIIFYNSNNKKLNILHKRKDGNFGLIEPLII